MKRSWLLKRLISVSAAVMLAATVMPPIAFAAGQTESSEFAGRPIAFPGADGAGKFATGGRGGEVYHVTNLNDSGTGSLRDAVSKRNRIVVFDVGGTISLKSDLSITDNVTVMGQTAPGGAGVTVRNGKLAFGGDNIIVRYVASRPGEKGSGEYDAWGGSKGSNSIIDHCSIGWANDEQFGIYSPEFLTVQYTIIGPANCLSTHSKGSHGFGPMIGSANVSWHHNLICHSMSRNFRGKMASGGILDFVNNVVYGWGGETAYGSFGRENYSHNYFKKSISTRQCDNFGELKSGSNYNTMKFYMTGNKMVERKGNQTNSAMNANNWNGGLTLNRNITYYESHYRAAKPFEIVSNGVNVSVMQNADTADEAFENVTSFAGAAINKNTRTKIDDEVLGDALNGTGSLSGGWADNKVTNDIKTKYSIKLVDYNEYYPAAITKKEIVDSDNDGMPDEWEIARGLNPNDASDANGSYMGGAYTNIEIYCNDLTVDSFPAGTVIPSPALEELGADYPKTIADYNDLKLPKNKISTADGFNLSTSGKNGSEITWSSSSDCVVIESNKIISLIQPTGTSNDTAYLKAEIKNGSCTLVKYFTLTVMSAATSWFASDSDNGKAAGSALADGLTTVSDIITKTLSSAVKIDGVERSCYMTSAANGDYDGATGAGKGTCLRYTAPEDGTLYAYAADLAATKTLYIVPEGASGRDEYAGMKAGGSTTTTVSAKVKAGMSYYIFPAGTKGELLGIKFVKNSEAAATLKPEVTAEEWSFNDIAAGASFKKGEKIINENGAGLVADTSDTNTMTIEKRSDGNNYLKINDTGTGRVKWAYTPGSPLAGEKIFFELEFNKGDISKDTTLLKVYDSNNVNAGNSFASDGAVLELKTSSNQGDSTTASELVLTDYLTMGTSSTDEKPQGYRVIPMRQTSGTESGSNISKPLTESMKFRSIQKMTERQNILTAILLFWAAAF